MAGIPHFKLDCAIPTSVYTTFSQRTQIFFKLTWDFFKQLEAVGYCSEIARNNGNAATFSPTPLGTGFFDEASAFGENAWAVFKFEESFLRPFPYYILIQWADNLNDFGAAPGNPGKLYGLSGGGGNFSFGLSMATAFNSSGVPENPFIPASGSMGSHIKSDPVWTTPVGGTLFVFPISNNAGGGYSTSKQNMMGFTSGTTINYRFSFIADKDNFIIIQNNDDGFVDNSIIAGGLIITASAIPNEVPLFCFTTTATNGEFADPTTYYGDLLGTDTVGDGGACYLRSLGVKSFSMSYDTTITRGTTANLQTTPSNILGLYPISVEVNRSKVGWLDPYFWRIVRNIANFSDSNMTRLTIATTASNDVKLAVPWDGSTTRGMNYTRNGIIS